MPIDSAQLLDLPGLRARELAEPGFGFALAQIAERLNLDPSFIGAVMSNESGFKPEATNPSTRSTGLIQFMPATASNLGTSVDELRGMSAVDQLQFVEKYFRMAGRGIRPAVPGDYYMATFLPAFVGAPAETVLGVRGAKIYDQNAGLDANKDGAITVGDVWAKIDATVAAARTRPRLEVKKKALSQLEEVTPWPHSLRPGSVSPSSLRPSNLVAGMREMKRELVLFAASAQLEDFTLMVRAGDAAGVHALVARYWAEVADAPVNPAHLPAWCGAFALWCLHQAGLGLELRWRFPTEHSSRSGFLWALERTAEPAAGDIAYLDQPFQHHAIVSSVDGPLVHTIDGNQGPHAPVTVNTRPVAHWTAFFSIASLLPSEAIS